MPHNSYIFKKLYKEIFFRETSVICHIQIKIFHKDMTKTLEVTAPRNGYPNQTKILQIFAQLIIGHISSISRATAMKFTAL